MMTRTLFAILILVALATASWSAAVTAQVTRTPKPKVTVKRTQRPKSTTRRTQVPGRVPTKATTNDDNDRVAEAIKVMAGYKQWMIGANKKGLVYPKSSNYNLKGTINKKFLQYERQGTGGGINIGWTDNASASTATARSLWYFQNQSNSNRPIRYGEPVAIAWKTEHTNFIKYASRTTGINLDWSKKPAYEWAILGGKPGVPVKRGQDLVVIYNLKFKRPLIYFKRTVGGHIGWPGSSTWGTTTISSTKHIASLREAVKALLMPGVPGSGR